SIFASIVSFVKSIFGIKDTNNIAVVPSTTPTAAPLAAAPTSEKVLGASTLQLGTLSPIDVYQKTCSFIKFRYNY
ncbi:MAG TPA: hypothetical protein VG965_00020, partial [Patescibacteria group bacterium]|nr:hypothetical protein [Patescibacteria group bacterium]